METRNPHQGVQWSVLSAIFVAGLVMLFCIAWWARIDKLNHEINRLDRLIAAETLRQGELARQRAVVCNVAKLEDFAQPNGMVKSPLASRQITVAALPEPDAPDAILNRQLGVESEQELAARPEPVQAGMAGSFLHMSASR